MTYSATTNQTIAAFFLCLGAKIMDVEKRPTRKYGDQLFLVFDISETQGNVYMRDFYDKTTLVAPLDLHNNLKEVRKALRTAREKSQ